MAATEILSKKVLLLFAMLVLFTFAGNSSYSQNAEENDEAMAPHFILLSEDAATENFPLLGTEINADIAGVIADVTVIQKYKNDGDTPIEAVYIFPASTNAAVYAMKMQIGDRTIKADIKEKQEAKQIYEKAKEEGKSASLLEQLKPNVFKMNVANILPGDIIEVELKYSEILKPVNKIYEFVFPTLVAPRYNSENNDSLKSEGTPQYTESREPAYDFDININLQTGIPIAGLECISHEVNIEEIAANYANIELDESESKSGNKDFILKYKLSGDKIETGLLLSENDDEKFFTLIVQPPERPKIDDIPPREYIFLMDVSGSMRGKPLTISKKLMINLLKGLTSQDRFNIIQFSGESNILANESLPVNQENIKSAIETIDKTDGGGGTEILNALKRIDDIPKEENTSRSVIIVTDGFVNVEREVFDFIRDRLNEMNVFAFGIGRNVNRYIIEGIASVGMGEPSIITNFDEANYEAERFRKYISAPVMTNIKAEYQGFLTYGTEPKTIPDVFAERPVIIYGKWGNNPTGKIVLEGYSGKEKLFLDIDVEKFATFVKSDALKYFWARNHIKKLADYESVMGRETNKKEILETGLKYNLLTDYTSFVAVDSEERTQDSSVLINQPLPHPSDGFGANIRTQSVQVLRRVGVKRDAAMYSGGAAVDALEPQFEKSDLNKKDNVFTKNIQKIIDNFECKNNFNKIIISVFVEIAKNNVIKSIDVIRTTHPDCEENAISAVRKFIEDYEKEIKKGQYQFDMNIDIPDEIQINLNNKEYELEKEDEYYFAEIKKGFGKKIELGDNVSIDYEIYNSQMTLMDSGKIEFMAGINEVTQVIDKLVTGAQKQAEFIILTDPYLISDAQPFVPRREFSDNIIIKFKITELIIE